MLALHVVPFFNVESPFTVTADGGRSTLCQPRFDAVTELRKVCIGVDNSHGDNPAPAARL
jgi:hypothetical protein